MKKIVILTIIAAVLLSGCNKSKDNAEITETAEIMSAESTSQASTTHAETSETSVAEATDVEFQTAVRINEPVDIINDIPLYIEYESDSEQRNPETRSIYTFVGEDIQYWGAKPLVISYDGRMMDIRAYEIYYDDWNDDSSYWLGKKLFDIWFPSTKDGFVLNYSTYISEYSPYRVLVLTDGDGNTYSYLLGGNKDGSLNIVKADIHKRRRGNDGVKHTLGGKEEITVKFYYIGDIDEYYENRMPYISDTVSIENFAEDMSEKMLLYSGLRVDDIWYEGTKLWVDLNVYEKYDFDRGSTAGGLLSATLMSTLYSLPDIDKIEILLDGERGAYADHFTFGELDVNKFKDGE